MNATAIRIALRDLRRGYRGFWIFFSCLALGVAAITTVAVLSSSLTKGIERDGKKILGGDIAVQQQFRNLSEEQFEALASESLEIAEFIELSTLLRAKEANNSILVSLKAVDGAYPLYGEVRIKGEQQFAQLISFQEGAWGAVVDPFLVESERVEIGDLVDFGTNRFRITGVIEDEPDRVASSGRFAFWPRVIVHRDSIEDSGLLGFGSRSNFEYRSILKEGVDTVALQSMFETQWTNLSFRDYRNASPDLSEIVQRIGVLLSLAGLTTLLVGGVGVSNAVRAYMETRLVTIAILKCIGGTNRFVFRTFLFQIVLLSAIGVLIGILAGTGIAVFASTAVERLLSVPLDITLDPVLMGIVIAYGMLTAMLFTLWPLACALNTSPATLFRNAVSVERQRASWIFVAITVGIAVLLAVIVIATAYQRSFAIWFVIGVSVAWIVFRLISLLVMKLAKLAGGRFSPIVQLALANLHRPGAATADTILAIGLGLSVLIATAMVSANLNRQISNMIPEAAPEFFFIGIQSDQFDEFHQIVEEIGGVTEVEVMPYIPGRITRIKGLDPLDALVNEDGRWIVDDGGERSFSYTAEPLKDVKMIAGDWWPPDYAGEPLLSIHEEVADNFDVGIGDEISINILGREITGKVRNIRDLEWRSMRLNFAITLSPEPLRSIPHSSVATAHVDEESEFILQDRIASAMPSVTVIRVKEALNRVAELAGRAQNAARSISAVTIAAGILVLAGIVISENRRRAYESVLLKTIGATRRYILATFSLEYLLQGTVSALAATFLGSLTSWAVVSGLMGWDWSFLPLSAVNTAILGLAISLILGMLGIWQALRHRPLYYLRNE